MDRSTDPQHINLQWCRELITELLQQGVRHFAIAPGSRSGPLALACAQVAEKHSLVHFDERGLGFYGLGISKSSRVPTVIICTSGTAAANFLPAIAEASEACITLIAITADRPLELRETGSPQVISQNNIYGSFVRWNCDCPCPNPTLPSGHANSLARRAYQAAVSRNGPVHLNCQFAEPLLPKEPLSFPNKEIGPAATSASEQQPDLSNITKAIQSAKRGIIIAADLEPSHAQAVFQFAKHLNWPIFPDIQSGLRLKAAWPCLPYYDLLLNNSGFVSELNPEVVIQFGPRLVSKRLSRYLSTLTCPYFLIHPGPRYCDPFYKAQELHANPISVCREILKSISTSNPNYAKEKLSTYIALAHETIEQNISSKKINEWSLANALSKILPSDSALFLASSLSVRLLDVAASANSDKDIPTGANRGANGIDGTIASALGFQKGCRLPCTLVIGDLAFFHDLNSLALVSRAELPMHIIVINNNGGGIFELLPLPKTAPIYEKYFISPQQIQIESLAKAFDIQYQKVENLGELQKYYQSFNRHQISEIFCDRHETNAVLDRLSKSFENLK